jgi:hypothetical protein
VKSYWEREGSFFHGPTISNIMTRRRIKELVRCLHITDPATYEHIPNGDPEYDKIWQIRWLVEEIRSACMKEWSLGEFLTIDEMMVWYKWTYCPIRQYIPKKSEKWGIKFWMLVDSASKFIYCFNIYCGKNLQVEVRVPAPIEQGVATYGVVMNLLQGLEDKGHYMVMDNFFTSIPLFRDMARKGIYTTSTIRSNWIGIPTHLKNTWAWKKCV